MYRYLFGLAALVLSACTQPPTQPARGCARTAIHEINWTSSESSDVVTAASDGPSCAQAVVTLTARNAAGDPLFVFSATHYALAVGDGAPAGSYASVAPEAMDTFLTGWANVTVGRTGTLPPWQEDAATLTESATTFSYDTPFTRDVYERMRALDLPLVCYASGAESTQCMILDPASHAPSPIVTYGP